VVVADSRSPRDGRFIERIGYYDPIPDPAVVVIDEEKALRWLMVGAQPTDTVKSLLSKVGIWAKFTAMKEGRVQQEEQLDQTEVDQTETEVDQTEGGAPC
jgi:small subunit ribosomal protein S16